MIGLVLVTHGRLGDAFVAALEHVAGRQERLRTVCIGPDDDMQLRRLDILDAIAAVNDGSGVVVLTDMFGGTPSNLAISTMGKAPVEVIAGVNLPMLVKLASVRRTETLARAVRAARDAGRSRIGVASWMLSGEPARAAVPARTRPPTPQPVDHREGP